MPRKIHRLIIKFQPIHEDSATSIQDMCEEILALIPNGQLVRPPSRSGRAVFSVLPSVDLVQLADRLSKHENIAYAEPDIIDSTA